MEQIIRENDLKNECQRLEQYARILTEWYGHWQALNLGALDLGEVVMLAREGRQAIQEKAKLIEAKRYPAPAGMAQTAWVASIEAPYIGSQFNVYPKALKSGKYNGLDQYLSIDQGEIKPSDSAYSQIQAKHSFVLNERQQRAAIELQAILASLNNLIEDGHRVGGTSAMLNLGPFRGVIQYSADMGRFYLPTDECISFFRSI